MECAYKISAPETKTKLPSEGIYIHVFGRHFLSEELSLKVYIFISSCMFSLLGINTNWGIVLNTIKVSLASAIKKKSTQMFNIIQGML